MSCTITYSARNIHVPNVYNRIVSQVLKTQCPNQMNNYCDRFSLRAFKRGFQGLPVLSKRVLGYDSGICCFKEVKTTAKILIILVFSYLSTLPHKSGISRFSDPFTTFRSYLKNKPILTLFGLFPDFCFLAKIKKIKVIFIICFFACLQFFKVKVGLTSAWTREFPIGSGSFRQ